MPLIEERRLREVPRGLAIVHPSLSIARAEGARVWDADGKEYLDFACGIGVLNVGHRHPRVVRAIADQADAPHAHGVSGRDVRRLRRSGGAAERARRRSAAQDAARDDRRRSDGERGEDRARLHESSRPSSRSPARFTAARCWG